jgi:hypothetical protein
MTLNEAVTAAREGTLAGRSPEVLLEMLKCCFSSNDPQVKNAVVAILAEIESQKAHSRHQAEIAEQQRLKAAVDLLTTGQTVLKESVDRLQTARRVDKAILVVTALGALGTLIGLFLMMMQK